jgi:hypothetical protein
MQIYDLSKILDRHFMRVSETIYGFFYTIRLTKQERTNYKALRLSTFSVKEHLFLYLVYLAFTFFPQSEEVNAMLSTLGDMYFISSLCVNY